MDTQHNYWKVAISGDLGSGKSTICKIIEEKLACTVYSTGKIQRKIAEKYNMTTLELNKYSETHPEIDEEIDTAVAALAKEPKNIVFDSRLAWHFVPDSFKVHLIVDIEVAAGRILKANRGKSESYTSLEDAIDKLRQRKTSENDRYCEAYQVDCTNGGNYDLIIDTSYASPERVAQLIIDRLNTWLAGKTICKYWLSPKVLYPTRNIRELVTARVQEIGADMHRNGFTEEESIPVLRVDDFYYIFDGHNRVSAAITTHIDPVPVNIIAEDNELTTQMGVTATEYVRSNCSMELISDWEGKHNFHYLSYPQMIKGK